MKLYIGFSNRPYLYLPSITLKLDWELPLDRPLYRPACGNCFSSEVEPSRNCSDHQMQVEWPFYYQDDELWKTFGGSCLAHAHINGEEVNIWVRQSFGAYYYSDRLGRTKQRTNRILIEPLRDVKLLQEEFANLPLMVEENLPWRA